MKSKNGNDKNLVFIPLRFLGPVRIAVPVSLHTICENTHTRIRAYNGKIEKRGIEIRFCFFSSSPVDSRASISATFFWAIGFGCCSSHILSLSGQKISSRSLIHYVCLYYSYVRRDAIWFCASHIHMSECLCCASVCAARKLEKVWTHAFLSIFFWII